MGGQSLVTGGTVATLDQHWLEPNTAQRTYRVAAGIPIISIRPGAIEAAHENPDARGDHFAVERGDILVVGEDHAHFRQFSRQRTGGSAMRSSALARSGWIWSRLLGSSL